MGGTIQKVVKREDGYTMFLQNLVFTNESTWLTIQNNNMDVFTAVRTWNLTRDFNFVSLEQKCVFSL
jgi:hypothetical protein